MSDWLNRYQARKQGAPARPAPPPPPQYQQPYQPPAPQPVPPSYGPPPPAYPPGYPQPVPGAPPHAPFGYDPATGVPVAPYGHDQFGRIMVQPPYAPVPQQVPQQPAYDPSGLPAPNGYGQPPYGQVHPMYEQAPQADGTPQNFHDRVRYAISHPEGNTAGNREVMACQQCGGPMVPTDASGFGVPDGMPQSAGVFNSQTGQTVYPAGHCMTCGHINRVQGSYAPGAGTAAMAGMVKATGPIRMAPGAGSAAQVASQHGLPNLFAPR
jgi:hypothetical protein